MKTIIFYWSKGALTRIRMIKFIAECEREGKPCYLNLIAEKLDLSRAALKKHIDVLLKYGYIQILNPGGKPNYLALTHSGVEVLKEFSS
jgi:DNA-binding MarR family transcriptional regulator